MTARTWTVELPAGLKLLSLNDRFHWAETHRRADGIKKAAWAMAIRAKVPRLDRIKVQVTYQPRPGVVAPDPDNIAPSGKHAIDGLVAARVILDDCPEHVESVTFTIGDPFQKGRLVLVITELTVIEAAGAALAAGAS